VLPIVATSRLNILTVAAVTSKAAREPGTALNFLGQKIIISKPKSPTSKVLVFIKERLLIDKKNVGANYFSDFKELENKYFESFNRFNVEYPDYTLGKTFCKVFFTRFSFKFMN
jgi:hypothetical protein